MIYVPAFPGQDKKLNKPYVAEEWFKSGLETCRVEVGVSFRATHTHTLSLSLYLSIYLSIYLFISLFIYLSINLSIYIFLSLYIYIYISYFLQSIFPSSPTLPKPHLKFSKEIRKGSSLVPPKFPSVPQREGLVHG